ncbi:MAG: PD40 domain-containing protein [Ignavibacteriales bacterium]|nr:PD40 domain-containing protein [Ignavibacteriales bacterium]
MKKLTILFLLAFINLSAQIDDFDPDYNWYSIKGENIIVHFHEEAERTARTVLKIAEEVWEPITSLYAYEPDEVHFIIKDIDDYSNGATYFFDNKIEIWSSALDFDLRGTHNWLRNVISHEFTHMVQIQAAMKMGRTIPAFYLQFLNYEDKRRPDILYGFPNFIASYPVATFNVPAWFAEGTAQYMREEFNYDNWDSHRDMILRSYALDNKMLSWNEMGVFSKTSLGSESVYNSGFALTRYIAQKYGEDKLQQITHKLGDLTNFTIDAAFKQVLGKDGNEIYDEWSEYLKTDYEQRISQVKENLVEGQLIAEKGFGNFYPIYSPDGKNILFISNQSSDYFATSGIYKYNIESKETELVQSFVRSTFNFIPGTNKIVYAKLSEDNPKWKNIHDLYLYDLDEDDETRLTFGLRANNPNVSSDGKNIVFLFQKDGTSNLGIVDIDGKNFKSLTFYSQGEQVYNPKFSADNKSITFGYSYHQGRDIAQVNIDGSGLNYIVKTDKDERNGFINSNNELIYCSDETGIFNIYKFDLGTKKTTQLTNVLGGAFMPSANNKGEIVYAGYTSSGYKIFEIGKEETVNVNPEKKYIYSKNPPLNEVKRYGDYADIDFKRFTNFNDFELPENEKSKYSGSFTRLTVLPFVRFDNYNTSNKAVDKIKPGVYLTSSDMLNRYSLFAGGSINTRLERDLFLSFIYKNKLPLLYSLGLKPELSLDIYSISRKADVDILFGVDNTTEPPTYESKINTDVTYNLFEVDLAAKHKIFNPAHDLEFRFIYSQYSAAIGSFIFPGSTTLYPSSSDDYFIGRNLQLTYTHNAVYPNVDRDINPIGMQIELKYNYEMNQYNPESEYEVENGVLVPVYRDYNFHRVELNFGNFYQVFDDHTLSAKLRLGTILGPQVPDFFDFYLGGLVGMKGYPFYAVSGNELAWLNLTYRFPVFKNIDYRVGHLYVDKLYFSVHGDYGNAWNGELPAIKEFKKGAGAEIRLKMISFYVFPTSLFFNASYSFDKFDKIVNDEIVSYGKEWNFYGGILFDFSF